MRGDLWLFDQTSMIARLLRPEIVCCQVISVKKIFIILGLLVLSIAYFSDTLPGNYLYKERDLSDLPPSSIENRAIT